MRAASRGPSMILEYLLTFGLYDLIFLSVLAISVVPAVKRGFTIEAVLLVGWPICFIVSAQVTTIAADYAPDYLEIEGASETVLWAVIFVAAMFSWRFAAKRFSPLIIDNTVSNFDRVVGFLYGLLRGVIVAMGIYGVAAYYAEGDENLPPALRKATFAPVMQIGLHLASDLVPGDIGDDLRDAVDDYVHRPRATGDIKKGIENSTPGAAGNGLLDLNADDYGY